MKKEDAEVMAGWKRTPGKFIEDVFGLGMPKLKTGYQIGINTELEDIKADWFEPFVKGKQITWQQWVVVLAVERAVAGGKRFISVSSGRGIGKSCVMAILLLWFLICHKDAQIPCTAPGAQQMYDVLWKEVAKWHDKLPENFKNLIEVGATYIRVKERPLSWFARAATARKEKPEALSGIHSDDVMLLIDEASGVPDEVFEIGIGSLTNKNAIVLMISNYTRNTGYFHRSQLNKYGDFQVLSFSAVDSPIVERDAVDRALREGEDSNEYRVNICGMPPKIDEEIKGYIPLLREADLRFTAMNELVQPIVLGIDPSGQGRNKTVIVARDPFRAVCMGMWGDLKPVQIMQKTSEIIEALKVNPDNVFLDAFGVGAEVMSEFMKARRFINGVMVGNPASDHQRYINLKAEMSWRAREWLVKGGELTGTYEDWEEVLGIRYFSEVSKIKIMGKRAMVAAGLKSPDLWDALVLTFTREFYEVPDENTEIPEAFDPFSIL